jgi:hypothetical protein
VHVLDNILLETCPQDGWKLTLLISHTVDEMVMRRGVQAGFLGHVHRGRVENRLLGVWPRRRAETRRTIKLASLVTMAYGAGDCGE